MNFLFLADVPKALGSGCIDNYLFRLPATAKTRLGQAAWARQLQLNIKPE
jgi:hypothetical protein